MSRVEKYYKAIGAALAGGLTTAYTALSDGAITPQEWVGVALGVLAGAGITAAFPANKPQQ